MTNIDEYITRVAKTQGIDEKSARDIWNRIYKEVENLPVSKMSEEYKIVRTKAAMNRWFENSEQCVLTPLERIALALEKIAQILNKGDRPWDD